MSTVGLKIQATLLLVSFCFKANSLSHMQIESETNDCWKFVLPALARSDTAAAAAATADYKTGIQNSTCSSFLFLFNEDTKKA